MWYFSDWTCTVPSNTLKRSEVAASRFELATRLAYLLKWFQMTVSLKYSTLRKSYPLHSREGSVFTKVSGRGRMPGALQRLEWSSAFGLGRTAKPWFQTNHMERTKHTTFCSPAIVAEGCTGHLGCITPSERCMNWIISHRSQWVTWPSNRLTALWVVPFGQTFRAESL